MRSRETMSSVAVSSELVASVVHRANLVKEWEKADRCAVSTSGMHGPNNTGITRIPAQAWLHRFALQGQDAKDAFVDATGDVERPLHANGPWLYKLSRIYQEPEVTAAVERIAAVAQARRAACVYESYAR
jgi:hypothetical protein